MNLTSFLKSNYSLQYKKAASEILPKYLVKSGHGTNYKDKCLSIKYPTLQDYGLIGTAFDYALRTRICLREDKILKKEQTIAYKVYKYLNDILSYNTKALFKYIKEYETIQKKILKSQKNSNVPGNLILNLLKSCLLLAKIDCIYRGNKHIDDFDPSYTELHLKDLLYLWLNTDMQLFESVSKELNPITGSFGSIITCSDADLLLDHKMVDIKTVKPRKDIENLMQCLGYLIIYNCKFILGVVSDGQVNFNKKMLTNPELLYEIGIYYSRHGEYIYVDLTKLSNFELNTLYDSFINCCTKQDDPDHLGYMGYLDYNGHIAND